MPEEPNVTNLCFILATYHAELYNNLEFFNTFKIDYTPSSYLDLTNKLSERKDRVKYIRQSQRKD